MFDITPIIRQFFLPRVKATRAWKGHQKEVQLKVLRQLLHDAANTEIGRNAGFKSVLTATDIYERFKEAMPTVEYEDIRADVMRMIDGEKDILWSGVCRNYAQSSGTSGGKSKFIPITADSLKRNHYRGSTDAVAHYLADNPKSHLFSGKAFILGGSFANELNLSNPRVKVGDLSATLINSIPVFASLFRIPSKRTALMSDWTEKLPLLASEASGRNVTNISGVPSWFLTVLKKICSDAGVRHITDVWPNLEVFFHGGIAFNPYREEYTELTEGKCHFRETYNASEGFFAVQNAPDDNSMLLILDAGVFYEFIPLSGGSPVPAWQVREGETYELVITACNGLWRYRIGDTVRIVSADPLKIVIAGRTKSFINAFGEELMQENADHGIAAACRATGATIRNYTAAPLFASEGRKARHQWLIEWEKKPTDIDAFAKILDAELCRVNSDYEAKRSHSIFLDSPEIISAPDGLFDRWLSTTGNQKLGGQRKIPRLTNNREVISSMFSIMNHGTRESENPD